jgi:hypothetical protein
VLVAEDDVSNGFEKLLQRLSLLVLHPPARGLFFQRTHRDDFALEFAEAFVEQALEIFFVRALDDLDQ